MSLLVLTAQRTMPSAGDSLLVDFKAPPGWRYVGTGVVDIPGTSGVGQGVHQVVGVTNGISNVDDGISKWDQQMGSANGA